MNNIVSRLSRRVVVGRACMLILLLALVACSETSSVPEGDKLFTGLRTTIYENYEPNDHFISTKEEVETALATAPNGSLAPYETSAKLFHITFEPVVGVAVVEQFQILVGRGRQSILKRDVVEERVVLVFHLGSTRHLATYNDETVLRPRLLRCAGGCSIVAWRT